MSRLDTCADSSDGIFRDVWIGFGEMEEKRAFQSIRFVQVFVDLDAVVATAASILCRSAGYRRTFRRGIPSRRPFRAVIAVL